MTVLAVGIEPGEAPTGTVFIVDDDADVRRSVALLVHSEGLAVEAFASAKEFLEHYDPQKPGCLILDVRLPGMSGLAMQKGLDPSKVWPPIIFVTAHAEVHLATEAIRGGAVDFIQKPFSAQTLLERIHEAMSLDRKNRQCRARACEVQQRTDRLTLREREIMYLLAAGQSTKQIAQELSISPKTVDNHRAKILKKMNVDNPTQLVHLLTPAKPTLPNT